MIEPSYRRFAGFDCGYKKLGVAVVDVDVNILELIKELYITLREFIGSKTTLKVCDMESGEVDPQWYELKNYIARVNERLGLFIRPVQLDVIDTLGGVMMKDVPPIERVKLFKRTISERVVLEPGTDILIENQSMRIRSPNSPIAVTNIDSIAVSYMLAMHYHETNNVEFVSSSLKSSVIFSDKIVVSKRGTRYEANKKYSREQMEYWCKLYNWDISNVPKESIDDLGDAFLMIIGHVRKMKHLKVAFNKKMFDNKHALTPAAKVVHKNTV